MENEVSRMEELMTDFLTSDDCVKIAFSCPGEIPESLPSWIEVLRPFGRGKPPKWSNTSVFKLKKPCKPTDLLRRVMARNKLNLVRVTARRKLYRDNTPYTVLSFMFDSVTHESTDTAHTEGMELLKNMLSFSWESMNAYRDGGLGDNTKVSVVLTRRLPEEGQLFGEVGDWGVQELVH